MNPSLHQIRALLDSVQPDIANAIIDRLNGHPRAQAYDGDRTTNGDGPSDPTANAAITPDQARADLAKLEGAVVRAYTALLCVAALSDRYQPTHEPRRGTIARDTRGCTLHDRAGITEHQPARITTDFASVLTEPLKAPIPVCRACEDYTRRHLAIPTTEQIIRHHRTGKWTQRTSGKRTAAFSPTAIADEWQKPA
jgi:hypothetical protein